MFRVRVKKLPNGQEAWVAEITPRIENIMSGVYGPIHAVIEQWAYFKTTPRVQTCLRCNTKKEHY